MKARMNHPIVRALFRLAGIMLLLCCSGQLFAAPSSVTISCTEASGKIQPGDCTVSGTESISLNLIKFAVDLIDIQSVPPAGCDLAGGGSCDLGNLSCSDPAGADTLHCELKNAPEVLSVNCTATSCTIQTDPDAVGSKLDNISTVIPIDQNLVAIGRSLAACVNSYSVSENAAIQDTLQNGLQEVCEDFLAKLETDPDQAAALLHMLQPLNPDAPSDLTASNIRLSLNTIQQRLFRLRSGIAANDNALPQGYYVNNKWHKAGTLFADNGNTASDASGAVTVDKNISEYGKLGIFVNAAFMKASQTNNDVELKSDAGSSVLTVGADYRFLDSLIGGVAFNITRSKTDFDDIYTSGSLDADGYALLLYGSYYVQGWFMDASVTLGGEQYQQERTPAAALGNTFNANFHGSQQSISGTAGYDFYIQSFSITPFAQLTLGVLDTDGYRETAANPLLPKTAPIGIDQHSKDIGNLNIGSHFRYVVNTDHGVFIPGISLTAVNDFENDAQMITGFFVANANPGDSFALKTNAVDSSYFVLALGFSFQLKEGNAGFMNIETVEGYENLDQQRLTAGWRWEI